MVAQYTAVTDHTRPPMILFCLKIKFCWTSVICVHDLHVGDCMRQFWFALCSFIAGNWIGGTGNLYSAEQVNVKQYTFYFFSDKTKSWPLSNCSRQSILAIACGNQLKSFQSGSFEDLILQLTQLLRTLSNASINNGLQVIQTHFMKFLLSFILTVLSSGNLYIFLLADLFI